MVDGGRVASHAGSAAHDAGILVSSRFIGKGQIINVKDVPLRFLPVPA